MIVTVTAVATVKMLYEFCDNSDSSESIDFSDCCDCCYSSANMSEHPRFVICSQFQSSFGEVRSKDG